MRTEDQIVAGEPLRVTLGGKQYEIKPLKINAQYRWRKRAFAALEGISKDIKLKRPLLSFLTNYDETAALITSLRVALVIAPRKAADLFFDYAKNLPRTQIEQEATETELMHGFWVVWKLGFPFFELASTALALSRVVQQKSQSAPPTNSPSQNGASTPTT